MPEMAPFLETIFLWFDRKVRSKGNKFKPTIQLSIPVVSQVKTLARWHVSKSTRWFYSVLV
jgi:hypothetical protein